MPPPQQTTEAPAGYQQMPPYAPPPPYYAPPPQYYATPAQPAQTREQRELERRQDILKYARRLDVGAFRGDEEPIAADRWLQQLENVFRGTRCSDAEKLGLAVDLLRDAAQTWWRSMVEHQYSEDDADWEFFLKAFREQYVPEVFREIQLRAFEDLRLVEGMSVRDYQRRFEELMEFAPDVKSSQRKKAKKFIRGLSAELKLYMQDSYRIVSYADAINSALQAEMKLTDMQMETAALGRSQSVQAGSQSYQLSYPPSYQSPPPQQGGTSQTDSAVPAQSRKQKESFVKKVGKAFTGWGKGRRERGSGSESGIESTARQTYPECPQCHKRHLGECRQGSGTCFHCGSTEHRVADCPGRLFGRQTQAPPPLAPARQSFGGQGSSQRPAMLTRQTSTPHQMGRGRPSITGRTSGTSTQQHQSAQLYALSRQEAQIDPNVIAGTLYINGYSVYALIDPGSTHSYVTSKIIPWTSRSAMPMGAPLYVGLPTGIEIVARQKIEDCDVQIGSHNFPADLILIKMTEFDVILGMDWLSRYRAKVDCKNKVAILMTEDGVEVTFTGSDRQVP